MKFYAMYSDYGNVHGVYGKQLHVFFNRRERNEWIKDETEYNGNYHRFSADDYLIADYRKHGNAISYTEHKEGKTYLIERQYDNEFVTPLDNETGEPIGSSTHRAY